MKKFLYKTCLFFAIFLIAIALAASLTSFIVNSRGFKNHQTESNSLVLRENEKYDLAFLGISHARNFSRYFNHVRMEDTLRKKILNLGQGSAMCGVNEQEFYLRYAYSLGIGIDTMVYFMSPPLLYGDYLNQASSTFNYEKFDWFFLKEYLLFDGENKRERLFQYVRTKLSVDWFKHAPDPTKSYDQKLNHIDSAKISEGFTMAYKDGVNAQIFHKNKKRIERTIRDAMKHNTKVILIIPPALFERWPGHNQTVSFCKQMERKYQVKFYDLSASVMDPKYYYDHHHLNSEGVDYFTSKYLKEVLN